MSGDVIGDAAQVGSSSHKLHGKIIVLVKDGCPHILTPVLQEQLDSFQKDLQKQSGIYVSLNFIGFPCLYKVKPEDTQ